jgi:hypothetical protein
MRAQNGFSYRAPSSAEESFLNGHSARGICVERANAREQSI